MRISILGAAAPCLLAMQLVAQTPSTAPKVVPPSAAQQPAAPMPAHPLTVAQAHEIMKLTGTDQIKQRLAENIMAYFQQRLPPFIPADVKTDLQASLEKMDIDTQTVATYQRYISTEDATQIIAFYETPAGKRLLAATPPLMQEIQRSALQNGQDTAKAVIQRHQTEIQAAQKQYEEQHSSQAPTLTPNQPSTPATPATPKN